MIDNLLSLQIKAIEKLKLKQEEIAQSLESFSNNFNSISEDKIKINNNIQSLRNELSNISIQIDNKIKDVLTSDNLYRLVFNEVSKQIKEIPTPKDGADGKDGANGKDGVSPTIDYQSIYEQCKYFISQIELPKPNEIDYIKVENTIKEMVATIKIPKGDNGKDGVGISNIKEDKKDIIIELSNGAIKKFKKSLEIMYVGGGGGGSSTYTNLNPVPKTVGGISAGTTFENMDITAVLDMLLYPFSASFSITPTTATMGQTVTTIDMTFSVSDSTATMEISNGVGDVTGTISYSLSGIFIADTSFTLTATKDSNTATINKSLIFLNYVYSGVTPNTAPIESEILASSKTLSNTKNKTVTYDCTGGNRFYIAYPQRMGTMSDVKVNGLPFNGYTVTTATITNEYSFSEVYTIYTSNNLVYGSAIPVIWS